MRKFTFMKEITQSNHVTIEQQRSTGQKPERSAEHIRAVTDVELHDKLVNILLGMRSFPCISCVSSCAFIKKMRSS